MIIPTKDYIILEKVKKDSLLTLPDGVDNSSPHDDYSVVKIGPDCKEVKIGDKLILLMGKMLKIKIKDKDVYFTRENEVSLIIRGENE